VLFRGVHGRLELDLSGRDKAQAGGVLPTFYSLSGEAIAIPEQVQVSGPLNRQRGEL
jgi:hypothetical protein